MKSLMIYILINTLTGVPLSSGGQILEYHDIGKCTIAATNIIRAMHTNKSDLYRCVPVPADH